MLHNQLIDLGDPFIEGLACAALHPGLRSVVVYDTSITELQRTAAVLHQMLQEVTKHEVVVVTLGVSETEDDLWGTVTLRPHGHSSLLTWQPGRLASLPGDRCLRLIVIPNLAQLSLPATRACVVLMGAEVAYLERHGQEISWAPNFCWLAGCARSDVGQISPHLMDRFTLRLSRPRNHSTDRVTSILSWLKSPSSLDLSEGTLLSSHLRKQLTNAVNQLPMLDASMIARVLEYFPTPTSFGHRREIALARLAVALARLAGSVRVTVDHVDKAAALIELGPKALKQKSFSAVPESPPEPGDVVSAELEFLPGLPLRSISTEVPLVPITGIALYSPDTEEIFSSAPLVGPYMEDTAPIEREANSLQLPPRRYRPSLAHSGFIIGTERATTLDDLAIVSTILEAAKFQKVRRKYRLTRVWAELLVKVAQQSGREPPSWAVPFHDRLLISAADLRCYRRSPVPEQMLVLVLDYTCLQDCDWEESLFPHLEWAYSVRANICLIQVGGATATGAERLRAQQIRAPNILAPRIRSALEEKPGHATPLAHGLDLAIQTLRATLQHGRNTVYSARLVVVTDGRGNVPLDTSRTGTIRWPVSREGIEDALQVAHLVQNLKHVDTFLLHPQPQQYPDLPIVLAEALGAIPSAIELKDTRGLSNE